MKRVTNSILAISLTAAMLVGGADIAFATGSGDSAKAVAPASAFGCAAGAGSERFDGRALYKAAFEAVRDKHIALTDPDRRKVWIATWEHRHETDGQLLSEEGTDRAIAEMLSSLGQRFDYYYDRAGTAELSQEFDSRKVVESRDLGDGLAYIRLSDFMSESAPKEFAQALIDAESARGLVIDLRGNPGGSFPATEFMISLILPEGTVVSTERRQGDGLVEDRLLTAPNHISRESVQSKSVAVDVKKRPPLLVAPQMPVAVLVDRKSYSSAEIFAGALQRHHRAVIVGEPTGGKGVGQSLVELPNCRAVGVTSFYVLPGGAHIDWFGVLPDVEVRGSAGDSVDNQLQAARQTLIELIEKNARLEGRKEQIKRQRQQAFSQYLLEREVEPSETPQVEAPQEVLPEQLPAPEALFMLKGKVVVLDPGHGGKETGATRAGIQEKNLTLEIALRLKRQLEAAGARVIMTRSDDRFVSLQKRVVIANSAGADIFVSIHANAMPQQVSPARGVEVWFRTAQSKRLAGVMLDSVAARLEAPNRGVHSRNLYVVHHTRMPSVLVEVGFLSNPDERAQLLRPDYQEKVASSVAFGLNRYWTGSHGQKQ